MPSIPQCPVPGVFPQSRRMGRRAGLEVSAALMPRLHLQTMCNILFLLAHTHRGWSSGLCRLAHRARPARAAPNPRAPSPLPAPGAYSTSPSSLLCPRHSPFLSHSSPVARIPPSLPWLAGRLVPPGAPMSPSHRGDPQQVPRAGSSPGGRSPPRCGFPPAAASQPPLPNVWGEEPSQAGGR